MYINDKKKLLSLLNTILEALDCILDNGDGWEEYVTLCVEALEAICGFIDKKDKSISLDILSKDIRLLREINLSEGMKKSVKNIIKQVIDDILYQARVIKAKKNRWRAVFLPYNASMWTSLESIWRAAYNDPDCDAIVMPIPYYDIGNPSNISIKYEGDQLPDYVPITHYEHYNIEEHNPEIIFSHNPYDDTNNLNRVPEKYFSSNLKKHTSCLVYSPYFTYGANNPGRTDFQYAVPGARNADFIIVQSDKVKEIFQSYGYPESKLLAVGSPKIDAIIYKMKEQVVTPKEWKDKLHGRKVFLLNTHLSYFAKSSTNTTKSGDYAVRFHDEILNTFLNRTDCALIWRPHPFLEQMLSDRFPKCYTYVKKMIRLMNDSDNCVIDRTRDYSVAFRLSDALITTYSSLINEYMVTGKPVMIFQKKASEDEVKRAPINRNLNYFRFKPDGMTFDSFVDMVCRGEDPLYNQRMDMINKAFLNMDGTAGEKAYCMVRDQILRSI
ncbi:CDP-glycerol glycerophosphotransferase family protein [Herbinix luporum]|uniref:CDP-glycerol glycerophosphotransferase family protein n=1 Tax=Herbinix luporum TaxID=1679721 RepID=UPI00176AFB82|nr:CDP-glycerol glycerophosphotransferase family protein [Herbinix luporum]HHT57295.1 hypothetical protein [Herbinix luporum]